MIYRYNPFFVISWEESLEELQDYHQIENISYGDVGSSLETVYCLMRQQVGVWGEVLLAFFLNSNCSFTFRIEHEKYRMLKWSQ